MKNSKDKEFIQDLKEITAQQEDGCFIVFDKKDITLKIDIDEVKIKMTDQEFYSKVDAKINDKTKCKKIIKLLNQIPDHLVLRLEADYIDQIIKLMKSKALIKKLKEQGTKFLYNGIEIEPRIIESKMDKDVFTDEIEKIDDKRDRLSFDCDENLSLFFY